MNHTSGLTPHGHSGDSYVSPLARIGQNNIIGFGAIIGPGVDIGDENKIGPYVIIEGPVRIGSRNHIKPGVIIGTASRQRIRFDEAPKTPSCNPSIVIGDDNILFERVSVYLPMGDITRIGNHVAIGSGTHVAHDCVIADDVVMAPGGLLGGYSSIGKGANLGLGVMIHPRTSVGGFAMCGMGTVINRHVYPGATVAGAPSRYLKPNFVGMKRNGFSDSQIAQLESLLNGRTIHNLDSMIKNLVSDFITTAKRWGRNVPVVPVTALMDL